MNTLIVSLLSGSLGALGGIIISIIYQNKHYKGNLVEKWMATLREEISSLLGLTEQLRLKRSNDFARQKLRDDDKDLHIIVAKQQKIHMLLNDNKEQTLLFESVKKIIELADKTTNDSGSYVIYERAEKQLVEQTRQLLREEWHKISRFSWKTPVFLFFGLIILVLVANYYTLLNSWLNTLINKFACK